MRLLFAGNRVPVAQLSHEAAQCHPGDLMGLRKRTVLVITFACILLTAVVFTVVREIVQREYAALERQDMLKNLDRGLHAFEDEGKQLLRLNQDWAFWDDTYEFIANPSQKYLDSNLPPTTFEEQELDLVAYISHSGDLVWGRMYDHVRRRPIIFPDGLLNALRVGGPVLGAAGPRGVHGCIPLDNGVIILAASPILTSEQEGPSRGWLVMGRKLVLDNIRELGRTTVLSLDAMLCSSPEVPDDVCKELQQKNKVIRTTEDSVTGYIMVQCLDGSRDLLLRVTQPRTIFGYGKRFTRLNFFTLLISMFCLGAVILLFVNRSVLDKLFSIGEQVRSIGESGDPLKRVHIDGGRELVALASEINAMLDLMNDNELFMRQVLDALEAGVILANPDDGKIAVANQAAIAMSGLSADRMLGANLKDFGLQAAGGAKDGAGHRPEMSIGRFRRSDGREIPALITTNRISGADRSYDLISFIDVSELEKTQQALQLSEDKYRTIFNNTGAASILIAPDMTIVLANREFESLSGLRREEVEGMMSWQDFFLNEDIERMREYHHLRRHNPEAAPRNYESRFVTSAGEVRDVHMTVAMLPDGRQSIASIMDITERKRAEERLAHQAFHDSLTGLPNRTLLLERLTRALRKGDGEAPLVGLLMADLDRFKNINDSFGHYFGDRLLRRVGERIQELVDETTTVSRLGGDEFLVLVEDARDNRSLVQVAENLLEGFREPIVLDGRELFLGMSIGIAIHPLDGKDADELLRNADLAMYRAKRLGRNTFCLYTSDLNREVRRRLKVENDLRSALLSDDIEVFFQPVVETATGRIVGAEGLARWRDPQGELRPPSEFIPVAEETGLITGLDLQVMRKACAEAVLWGELGFEAMMVSVNISAAHFLRRDIRAEVKTILESSDIRPGRLCLELTETAVMRNIEVASNALREVSELGVCVALDDFGTGYSSLSYLQVMPIKTLKIDRAFVAAIRPDDEESVSLVRTILSLGTNLRLRTVAEGVETREQFEVLRDCGCPLCQGFYFAKPMSAMEFRAFLVDGGGMIVPEDD